MALKPVNSKVLLNNVGKFFYFNTTRSVTQNLRSVAVGANSTCNSGDGCPRFNSERSGRDLEKGSAYTARRNEAWCNGLRKSLMSNLNGGPKSKLAAMKDTTTPKETDKMWYENETNENICRNVKCNPLDVESTCDTNHVDFQEQRNDSKWSTVVRKSFDINMNDLAELRSKDPNNNLSMDIDVVVNIKPLNGDVIADKKESRRVTPETEVAHENFVKTKQPEAETPEDIRPEVMNYMAKLKNPVQQELKADESITGGDIEDAASSLYREELVEEMQQVYSQYKQREMLDVPDELVEEQEPLEKMLNMSMAKKLYMISLQSARDMATKEENEEPSVVYKNILSSDEPRIGSATGPVNCSFLAMSLPHAQTKMFSTSAAHAKEKKKDCDHAKKLPCLQPSELSKVKVEGPNRGVCEKFCMPCCKPARDPPECFYPFNKPPCVKHKPPRAAFSECKPFFEMKEVVPCECLRPRGTTCKTSKASEKCNK